MLRQITRNNRGKNSDSKTESPFKNPLTPSSNPQKNQKKAKNHVLISKPLKTRTKPKRNHKNLQTKKGVKHPNSETKKHFKTKITKTLYELLIIKKIMHMTIV